MQHLQKTGTFCGFARGLHGGVASGLIAPVFGGKARILNENGRK